MRLVLRDPRKFAMTSPEQLLSAVRGCPSVAGLDGWSGYKRARHGL